MPRSRGSNNRPAPDGQHAKPKMPTVVVAALFRLSPTTFNEWLAAVRPKAWGPPQTVPRWQSVTRRRGRSDPALFGVQTARESCMTTFETGDDAASSEGAVTVAETGSGTYTQQITARHHRLVSDEPQPIGADAGPTPYHLLLAGLGACTSMTVRMYANRKGWPLKRVRVTLRHSRIHAKDCADCETSSGWIDHIDRDVELAGNLDDTQRQRLLHIAERCPVHQTLTSEVHIATSLR
jgi:putative redox protein